MTKFIFITGGVVSSLGKGICAASIGSLLSINDLNVNLLKLDPYLNVDPGTMSPFQHGEVFVTEDGAETDLDLGYYERFTGKNMSKDNNLTSGQAIDTVLKRERQGLYKGNTVQTIPHITDQIKNHVLTMGQKCDILVTEIGGTVGDIESLPFLESIRQLKIELGNNLLIIHLTYLPYIAVAGELKTKPTQHSVKELRSLGLQPDIIICRSETGITTKEINKISLFTSVPTNCVIDCPDLDSIYKIPELLHKNMLDLRICEKFQIPTSDASISRWENFTKKLNNLTKEVKIALVGKYISKDSYKSLMEAIVLAGINCNTKINLELLDAEQFTDDDSCKVLDSYNAVVIPGGFGDRGVEGKILACKYSRLNKIPYLGICLGLQIAVVEFARNELKLSDANSVEFALDTKNPVIGIVEQWEDTEGKLVDHDLKNIGGTMRLGAYECKLKSGSKANTIYNTDIILERHRHRFEVNSKFTEELERLGMSISGRSLKDNLVEMIEISSHPWFIACQFHPEFNTKIFNSHPLFNSFVMASLDNTIDAPDE